jgi:hypothetical protein
MKFGEFDFDPAKNPAVLDTATWDPDGAWRIVSRIRDWRALPKANGHPAPKDAKEPVAYAASEASFGGRSFFLAGLNDGQQVFVETGGKGGDGGKGGNGGKGGDGGEDPLGKPCFTKTFPGGARVAMYKTDADVVKKYVTVVKPGSGPRALGLLPRLGVGVRMSTSVWPAVWYATDRYGFSANAIQNSLRELNLLDDLKACLPARSNYLFNFGEIAEGHTGSTFEGLWTYGVLDALKHGPTRPYGADADHIMVKRGDTELRRAKQVIEAARHYSFFTLDVSDVVEYGAQEGGSTTEERLTAKYDRAFQAVDELSAYIRGLKNTESFDLELSIDEHPPSVNTCESVTTERELSYILSELGRRGIPVTHVAPNFGVEKGVDYGCPDGLEGLESRVRALSRTAGEFGVRLDCHSGDDLSQATRRTLGRASGGGIHFKISPSLQIIFAEVLREFHPETFKIWWDDTLAYARREAEGGSGTAARCVRDYEGNEGNEGGPPSPNFSVFHSFCFATVGKRDGDGRFVYRDMFYDLAPAFHAAYRERVQRFLCAVAEDLYG